MRLVLASGSTRRAQLMEQLGLDFDVVTTGVDEARYPHEPPGEYVERVAREKCIAAAAPGIVVIAADTAVVHEGKVMGKPAHPEEARSMLRRLQGDTHQVFTGVAVGAMDGGTPAIQSEIDVTRVSMVPMTDDEIHHYVSTGEPMGKAGAYALQGFGGVYVQSVDGSPYTVIGLPVHLLPRLIAGVGARFTDFLSPPPGSVVN